MVAIFAYCALLYSNEAFENIIITLVIILIVVGVTLIDDLIISITSSVWWHTCS